VRGEVPFPRLHSPVARGTWSTRAEDDLSPALTTAKETSAEAVSSSTTSWNLPSNSSTSSRASEVSTGALRISSDFTTCTAKSSAPVRDAMRAARRSRSASAAVPVIPTISRSRVSHV